MVEEDQERMSAPFKLHRVGDKRMCGATTVSTGKNTKVIVEGQPGAVEGDKDDHNMLGDLVSMIQAPVKIQGQRAIAALADQGSPDQIGIIPHVTGLPTPAEGAQKVKIGMGALSQIMGMMKGGQGGSSGGSPGSQMQQGEQVNSGGDKVGNVYRHVRGGGAGFDVLVLSNTSNSVTTGTTVTGQNSGVSFTFSNIYS